MSGGRVREKNLRDLLARLRERLSQARLDPESRKHLATLVQDIDGTLGEGGAQGAAGAGGRHTHRLESLAVRFEADHPSLAEVIREVIDALARAGI
jgi:hypothetical protein